MTPLAPFISHGAGLLIAWLVALWRLDIDADQQKSAADFVALIFQSIAIWIAVHLGYSWKFNPRNAVSPTEVKQCVVEKAERKEIRAAAKREAIVNTEVPYPTPEDSDDLPPRDYIPAKEKGDL